MLGFIDQEPEVIHLGTARNALRITDKSIKQHFYSDFDREDMEGHYAEHILSKKNLKEKVLKNGNIIRILNFKALVYDLIRNKDSYSDDELIGILTRIEKCRYLKGVYRVIKRNRWIFINSNLSEWMQKVVCAHELGHDQ